MSPFILCSGLALSFAYENVALRKPTYQQYQRTGISPELTDASNAVDGLKTDLGLWGGQCVYSESNKHSATWWVNLTGIMSINHIMVYYMTGNVQWGTGNSLSETFLGFSLYVSNTTNKSDGTLCFEENSFNISTIPTFFNVSCSIYGQNVIYYNERLPYVTYPSDYSLYAVNALCEVEVFGECPSPGYYGLDCSMQCPDSNCRYCHIETGICQGCKPGYQGHRCEIGMVSFSTIRS